MEVIEIPFGAKDSELQEWTYTIPEGMKAEIRDGKVIIKKKESEDERIRKGLLDIFKKSQNGYWAGMEIKDIVAWLEKQKEQKPAQWSEEDKRIRKTLISIVKWLGFDSSFFTDNSVTKSEVLAYLEKQKEQKPVTINQDEKEFLADEITAFLCNYDKEFDGEDPVPSEVAEHFYLLGKQAQEQKSTEWSEEDKETIDLTIAVLKENLPNVYFKTNPANTLNMGAINTDQLINRLKSLKDRENFPKSNTNSPSEWSEEDKKMLLSIIKAFRIGALSTIGQEQWLKLLPDRFNLQPKDDEIEEDE